MKSRTTRKFWRLFDALPDDLQERARTAYGRFSVDPLHPSLQFKKVNAADNIYSVRVGLSYRALGLLDGDTVTWFWIGDHDTYERLLED